MSVTIQATSSPGEVRIAAVRDGVLLDYSLWRPGAPDGVGDLHRGRVIAVVPGMAGAFIALGQTEGFLPDSEGAKGLSVGAMLGVRVTRAAQGAKGPRLSAKLTAAEAAMIGHGSAGLLRRGADPLLRLAWRYPDASIEVDDAALALSVRTSLADAAGAPPVAGGPLCCAAKPEDAKVAKPGASGPGGAWPADDPRGRVLLSRNGFADAVAEAVDALSEPVVSLPSGASLSIWPTPALVAIDVDAGSGLRGGGGHRALHEALNRAVLPALAAQIRLRNLSGAIVLDLAGLSARKRVQLAPGLADALRDDPLRPKFLGFTALGLAEIVRARIHPPLHEMLAGPLAAGLAALRAVLAAVTLDPRAMPALRAAPAVISALRDDGVALTDLVRRGGRDIMLRSDPSLPACSWTLERDDERS